MAAHESHVTGSSREDEGVDEVEGLPRAHGCVDFDGIDSMYGLLKIGPRVRGLWESGVGPVGVNLGEVDVFLGGQGHHGLEVSSYDVSQPVLVLQLSWFRA